jgi:hypothetical protein
VGGSGAGNLVAEGVGQRDDRRTPSEGLDRVGREPRTMSGEDDARGLPTAGPRDLLECRGDTASLRVGAATSAWVSVSDSGSSSMQRASRIRAAARVAGPPSAVSRLPGSSGRRPSSSHASRVSANRSAATGRRSPAWGSRRTSAASGVRSTPV